MRTSGKSLYPSPSLGSSHPRAPLLPVSCRSEGWSSSTRTTTSTSRHRVRSLHLHRLPVNIRKAWRTSERPWMTRGAASGGGVCSAGEATDVETGGTRTWALGADPGCAGGRGSEHGPPRGARERDLPQPEAAEEPVRPRDTRGAGGLDP